MVQRAAGWYADPVTVGAARYWNGRGWTDSVSWGGTVTQDPTPVRLRIGRRHVAGRRRATFDRRWHGRFEDARAAEVPDGGTDGGTDLGWAADGFDEAQARPAAEFEQVRPAIAWLHAAGGAVGHEASDHQTAGSIETGKA
jgi:hypothetical protein